MPDKVFEPIRGIEYKLHRKNKNVCFEFFHDDDDGDDGDNSIIGELSQKDRHHRHHRHIVIKVA